MGSLPSQFFISCPLKYHKVKAICGVNTAGTQRGGKLKLICNFNERRLRPKIFPKWKKKGKKKKTSTGRTSPAYCNISKVYFNVIIVFFIVN